MMNRFTGKVIKWKYRCPCGFYREMKKFFHKIQGNNDLFSFAKPEMMLALCGHNIFATHGHAYGVRGGTFKLAKTAADIGCDIALFGHTHNYADEVVCGVRCLNPSNNGYFIITEEKIEFFEY